MRSNKLLFSVVFFLAGTLMSRGDAPTPVSPLVGQVAPDFQLTDAWGQRLTLGSLKGKTVVLDFWATWCPPCREELPVLNQLAQSFSPQPVVVLGIDAPEDPDIVRRFLQANPPSYRILLTYDNDSPLRAYGVDAYPFIVLIDRNGIVAGAGNYPANTLESTLRSKLQRLLANGYVSPKSKGTTPQAARLAGVVYPEISMQDSRRLFRRRQNSCSSKHHWISV